MSDRESQPLAGRMANMRRLGKVLAFHIGLALALASTVLSQSPPSMPSVAAVKKSAAILIFDGVQIIDFTGPWEILDDHFAIFTVAATLAPITTSAGMSVNPRYTFATAPKADVLIVPGGGSSRLGRPGVGSQMANPRVIQWVRDEARDAQYVMSVCNGAFILAQAGLLDGLKVTTTAGFLELLRTTAPRATVVPDVRYVDNGKIITTAGLSSGIDGALHIIDKMFGRGVAQFTALGAEYDWDPTGRFVRAQLGDMPMLNTFVALKFRMHATPIRYDTSSQAWHSEWLLDSAEPLKEVVRQLNDAVELQDHWKRIAAAGDASSGSRWTLASEMWGDWNAVMRVQPSDDTKIRITIDVERSTHRAR